MKRLTIEQGIEMMEEYGTPKHVQGHCRAVTETALSIAAELNRAGFELDLPLIEGAGIIHDIARKEDRHWDRGAEIAMEKGLDEEAEIIRHHMHHTVLSTLDGITELDLVCLGDRTCCEDQFVGLEKRIEYIVNKARRHGASEEHIVEIRTSMEKIQELIDEIEEVTGKTLDEICKKEGN